MIALVQRVKKGKVLINNEIYSSINQGYVILIGIFEEDNQSDVVKLADKIVNLRIIPDGNGKMNRSILNTKEEILLVSQFTLCADVAGGRRPSFIRAKKPEEAKSLYRQLAEKLGKAGIQTKTGKFGGYMEVQIFNDGPITIILDSKKI